MMVDPLVGADTKVSALARDRQAIRPRPGDETISTDLPLCNTAASFLEGTTALFLDPQAADTSTPGVSLILSRLPSARLGSSGAEFSEPRPAMSAHPSRLGVGERRRFHVPRGRAPGDGWPLATGAKATVVEGAR